MTMCGNDTLGGCLIWNDTLGGCLIWNDTLGGCLIWNDTLGGCLIWNVFRCGFSPCRRVCVIQQSQQTAMVV